MKPAVALKKWMMSFLISDTRRNLAHRLGRRKHPGVIYYFHQVDDPYSHLTAQKLEALRERYNIPFTVLPVSSPAADYQGDATRFRNWALRDAASVAAYYDTSLPDDFADTPAEPESVTAAGDRLREALGHYLSATFYYEGEWYWGLDRLLHLERRLIDQGLSRDASGLVVPRPEPPAIPEGSAAGVTLEFFPSLRSPYTAISFNRTIDMVKRTGVEFRLRPVMPMMMRGVTAPRPKQMYIMSDCKREADYYGEPFGPIVDPFGEPVKRAFALLPYMIEQGKDVEFCGEYLVAAWTQAVDITVEDGLKTVVERTGVDWPEASASTATSGWEALLDDNVADMLDAGLWGVPSFRVTGGNREEPFACWGQDRLWRVETEIAERIG